MYRQYSDGGKLVMKLGMVDEKDILSWVGLKCFLNFGPVLV